MKTMNAEVEIKPIKKLRVIGWVNEPLEQLYRIIIRNKCDKREKLVAIGRLPKEATTLIVCFPGYNDSVYPHFYDLPEDEMGKCGIIFPQDSFSTCWLGEADRVIGNSLRLLAKGIYHIKKWLRIEKTIYMGTSMGGYGALAFSLVEPAEEVYVCSPVVSLEMSKESFSRVGALQKVKELLKQKQMVNRLRGYELSDISKAIRARNKHSMKTEGISASNFYHITCARYEDENDKDGVCQKDFYHPLLESLNEAGIKYSAQIIPVAVHDALFYPGHVKRFSERYAEWLNKSKKMVVTSRKELISRNQFVNSLRLEW